MINFILTTISIFVILFARSKHNIIALTHFICLTTVNIFFLQNNDLFAKSFSVAIQCICLICSIWNMQKAIYKPQLFYISLLSFALCAMKAFCATDAISMFIYMETSMIPMVLMMCSENKSININAIYQYLIYTFISACLLLIAIIQIKIDTKEYGFTPTTIYVYWLIVLATLIKLPTFPFHYWIPVVHGRSATTCSVLLAGVILKYSSLIAIRFLMPLHQYAMYLILASVISAVCSQCREKDIKVIFAYSSIIHMNLYLFIPIAYANHTDFIFSLLSHSITMTLAFLVTDIVKTRYKTLCVDRLTNISNKLCLLLLIVSLCITAVPGSIGFVAELQALCSANKCNLIISAIAITVVILSFCYVMYIYFKLRDNVCKYDLFKINVWQKITLLIIFILVIGGGTLPLLHAFQCQN